MAKKWHGSDEGKQWHSNHLKNMWSDGELVEKKCEQCGNLFKVHTLKYSSTRFCSNACKSKYRRCSGIDNEIRVCPICGNKYECSRYSKKKTCSKECASELANRTKLAKREG